MNDYVTYKAAIKYKSATPIMENIGRNFLQLQFEVKMLLFATYDYNENGQKVRLFQFVPIDCWNQEDFIAIIGDVHLLRMLLMRTQTDRVIIITSLRIDGDSRQMPLLHGFVACFDLVK